MCGAQGQVVHERVRRSWRHPDLFLDRAWLHASISRVGCTACGKTGQLTVPWAREGSGFTTLFGALVMSLCEELDPAQPAGRLQAPGVLAERALRDRSARHVRAPQQRLRGSHERLPIVGRARCPEIQKRSDLHRHRLPAHCPAHGPEHFTIRSRQPAQHPPCGSAGAGPSAKENDVEPLATPRLTIVANASCRLVTEND
ncbi:transposase family protein [Pseudorhodoferax soli]|uniref:transposase family protein n=1 Tax=Pseudorhodoferax soli TaxID=545864 RepID=UPI003CCC550B